MHDPSTVAFSIDYPWGIGSDGIGTSFITIWHTDTEKDGSDDSCGWFLRPRHLDGKVLDNIVRDYTSEWDGVFECDDDGRKFNTGLFLPNGQPHLSVSGVTLNLFYRAALRIFESKQKGHGFDYQKKAKKYMQNNIADILLFAENTTDSLFDSITRKFENGCGEEYTPKTREERIHKMAGIIYSYIVRDIRPWYRHPKWHVHHWSFQIHPLQKLKRFVFDRCFECKKRFGWNESPTGQWSGKKLWHCACYDGNKITKEES